MTDLEVSIRPLRPDDDRTSFRSGDPELDRFFLKYAGQNQFRHHLGQTYVAVTKERIVGFLTLSAGSIQAEHLPRAARKKLPLYPLPILRLARLAVDETCIGEGVGFKLLKAAFMLARDMENLAGCVGVVVDAKPDAVAFYERFGFKPFETATGGLHERPQPATLFLPLGAIPEQ